MHSESHAVRQIQSRLARLGNFDTNFAAQCLEAGFTSVAVHSYAVFRTNAPPNSEHDITALLTRNLTSLVTCSSDLLSPNIREFTPFIARVIQRVRLRIALRPRAPIARF